MDITTRRPDRSTPSAWPSWICQDRAPKHSPKLEGPPGRPPTLRQGQMASQLHPSKYEPRTRQSTNGLGPDTAITNPPHIPSCLRTPCCQATDRLSIVRCRQAVICYARQGSHLRRDCEEPESPPGIRRRLSC